MELIVETRLNSKKEETYEIVKVSLSPRAWNAIRPGWEDIDEYDYGWNCLCDAVTNHMSKDNYADWYIHSFSII